MKDYAPLKVMDRFSRVFRAFGADYPVMRRILAVKLTMDARRVPAVMSGTVQKDPEKQEDKNHFFSALWMYGFFGFIMIPFIVVGKAYMLQMSVFFGSILFFIITGLISDFTSVLLDVRDRTILFTRPVSGVTIGWAKAMHVLIYLTYLGLAVSAPPVIAALIKQGVEFAVILAAELALTILLSLVATALFYLLVLRLFDGELLKDMINYLQIGLSIAMAVGYQLVGKAFSWDDLLVAVHADWWHLFMPPLWFAAPFELLLKGDHSFYTALLSGMALLVPPLALLAYVRLLPSFERNLQKLAGHVRTKPSRANGWWNAWSRLLCRTKEERAFFRFSVRMMASEREFKLKVYPSMGLSMVLPFIMVMNELKGGSPVMGERLYLSIYSAGLMIPTVMLMLQFSSHYKAAWLFGSVPLQGWTPFYKGALKACMIRLLLPVYACPAIVFAARSGWEVVPHLAAALAALVLFITISFQVLGKKLPFTVSSDNLDKAMLQQTLPMLLLLLGFSMAHLAATLWEYGVYAYLAVLLAANVLLWRRLFRPSREFHGMDNSYGNHA